MKIKDIPKMERPREQLIMYGSSRLSNEDLLAIIISTGTKNKSAKEIAIELLKVIDNFNSLEEITFKTLTSIKGIGLSKAAYIMASIELGKRLLRYHKKEITVFNTSQNVFDYFNHFFYHENQEIFMAIYLDNKNQLITYKKLFVGTIDQSVVHPREIFKYAYLNSASKIICIHNHPSGDLTPSKQDINFTMALIKLGELNNILIVDHLIICNNKFHSMFDK